MNFYSIFQLVLVTSQLDSIFCRDTYETFLEYNCKYEFIFQNKVINTKKTVMVKTDRNCFTRVTGLIFLLFLLYLLNIY